MNRIESIFAWNLNALLSFHNCQSFSSDCFVFFPAVIQGFVGELSISETCKLLLISRRSYIMGGTRYNSRGINPSGFVGNYVETEQIINSGGQVYSFIQIRGSVPIYWDQKHVSREVNFSQSDQINREVMLKHFHILRDQFHLNKVLILNLLSKKKKNEQKLGRRLHQIYLENFTRESADLGTSQGESSILSLQI